MSPAVVWASRIVALVLFAGIMWVIGQSLDWSVRQLPFPLATLILGLLMGGCIGYLMGEREGRALERRRAEGLER